MEKTRIAVIYGGKSGEHEVSIVSARSVMEAMDKNRYEIIEVFIDKDGSWVCDEKPLNPWKLKDIADFALPVLHGPNGEDGTVQGLLQLLGMPYGGSGVIGCAASMDKIVAKKIFKSEGIPQAAYLDFSYRDLGRELEAKIAETLNFPVFIKPANMGSSVGITKVEAKEDLKEALELAAKYDTRLVAEEGIKNARELEVAIMGNYDLICGKVGEIVPKASFYDYDAKYKDGTSLLLVPAPITKEQEAFICNAAKKAYKALGCCGFARVDFLMDGASEEIYLNEINAIPGFTNISMFPRLMMAAGMEYSEIIDKIVEFGYERYNAENNR